MSAPSLREHLRLVEDQIRLVKIAARGTGSRSDATRLLRNLQRERLRIREALGLKGGRVGT